MAEGQLIEPIAEGLEVVAAETLRFSNKQVVYACSVLAFGMGFYSGYNFAKKRLKRKYIMIAEEEIESMREKFHSRVEENRKSAEEAGVVSPEKPPLEDVVKDLKYTEEEQAAIDEVEEEIVEPDNVFDSEWDYAVEIKKRQNFDKPYVIHEDEYIENEGDYTQVTYSYFETDDILIDDRNHNQRIEPKDEIVGLDNLQLFGHGSQDPNIVFVRNDSMSLDMEIARSPGSFSEEVLGVIEHSEGKGKKRRRDRRFDDD